MARLGAGFILEIKKASPSQGSIRPHADVAELARGYAPVADALSVLTDSAFFGGSLDDVATARANFAGPILAKDFFVDLCQVAEARIAGADAILVMLSVLDDEEARAMIAEALRFGMDCLVEVHDEAEMRRALALEAPLIGINNRDLRDLSINLATTERLAPLAADGLLVSESGVSSRSDVDRLCDHVDGFLVGSALMRSEDPVLAARELVHGRVKLCGLRTAGDVAAGAAASFAGFVFVEQSRRFMTVEQAVPLADQARMLGVRPVGVFRDTPLEMVADAAQRLELRAVQLHGAEDEDYVAALRRCLPAGCETWTAIDASRPALSQRQGDRLLFDNGGGGTGRRFDWGQVAGHPSLGSAIVAGGVGPECAAEARSLGAFAIDVGSSLDAAPGVKSAAKIAGLFDALRPAARGGVRLCA
jgi:indole-3-glycerol phosphate synthase/phosphoribosylanthranilate isomerase